MMPVFLGGAQAVVASVEQFLRSLPKPESIRARLAIIAREQQLLKDALRIAERAEKNRQLDAESHAIAGGGTR